MRSKAELEITGEPWHCEYIGEADAQCFTGRVLDKDNKLVFTISPERTPLEGVAIAERINMIIDMLNWANNSDIEAGIIETTARYPIRKRN